MTIYQHDAALVFRLQIVGALRGLYVAELEQSWRTARSIMEGKALVVDLSGLSDADERGMQLLARMRDAGAKFVTASRPEALDVARRLGLPTESAPAHRSRCEARVCVSWLRGRVIRTLKPFLGGGKC